jgi:hypothetical protein
MQAIVDRAFALDQRLPFMSCRELYAFMRSCSDAQADLQVVASQLWAAKDCSLDAPYAPRKSAQHAGAILPLAGRALSFDAL